MLKMKQTFKILESQKEGKIGKNIWHTFYIIVPLNFSYYLKTQKKHLTYFYVSFFLQLKIPTLKQSSRWFLKHQLFLRVHDVNPTLLR
jgi:hypothetical protein